MTEGRFTKGLRTMIEGWTEFFGHAFTALTVNGISGDYAEFGSLSGTTMWLAHDEISMQMVPRHLWAFDSFTGYPESDDPRDLHPSWTPGTSAGSLEEFRAALENHEVPLDAYTAVVGYYDDTLPPLQDGEPADIALAYLDCNLYSSTVTVLDFLRPRLKHGMIIAFDDYFCWTPTEVSGERVAFEEFATALPDWQFTRYRDIHWAGTSFVVEHRRPPVPAIKSA